MYTYPPEVSTVESSLFLNVPYLNEIEKFSPYSTLKSSAVTFNTAFEIVKEALTREMVQLLSVPTESVMDSVPTTVVVVAADVAIGGESISLDVSEFKNPEQLTVNVGFTSPYSRVESFAVAVNTALLIVKFADIYEKRQL